MLVLPKVRNFIWKMIKNGLPTNGNRCYRHIANDVSCEMCYAVREDCYPAIMECPHAKSLRGVMREMLAMILWRAWTIRNKVTRVGEALSIDGLVQYLMNLAKELQAAGRKERVTEPTMRMRSAGCQAHVRGDTCWSPPPQAAIKINVDGAFNQATREAALGVIVRDHEGQPQVMVWRLLHHCRGG
jgi:hypothetical protein